MTIPLFTEFWVDLIITTLSTYRCVSYFNLEIKYIVWFYLTIVIYKFIFKTQAF